MTAAALARWERFPEYRPVSVICVGDQTAEGDSYGWSTVESSLPCTEHEDCHVLGYYGDTAGTHRPRESTMLSRMPLNRAFETTMEIQR